MFVVNTCFVRTKVSVSFCNSLEKILNVHNNIISCKYTNRFYSSVFGKLTEKMSESTSKSCNDGLTGQLRLPQKPTLVKSANLVASQSSKKRPLRRKLLCDEVLNYDSVLAFATADEYDMELLKDELIKHFLYKDTNLDEFKRWDILHLKAVPPNGNPKELYIFGEGSIVFWNVSKEECDKVLKFIKPFELGSYENSIILSEQEVMHYKYGENGIQSSLVNGVITLASDKGEVESALDKYTFSNSMVLSVKLGIWECILECFISEVQLLTEDLKFGKKIRISRKDVLKKTGEIFSLRHAINLSSDILDVPDFYWELESQEKLYLKMYNYFAINRRTTVINSKINHCLELLDLLASQLNDKHHVRLEWMIIYLITVEVAIAIGHMLM